jgi:hypothetical protein
MDFILIRPTKYQSEVFGRSMRLQALCLAILAETMLTVLGNFLSVLEDSVIGYVC